MSAMRVPANDKDAFGLPMPVRGIGKCRRCLIPAFPSAAVVQFLKENVYMDLNPSSGPKLSPNERKIVDYLSGIAAETPDRRGSKSIREIAEATGLGQRTVQIGRKS